MARNIELKVRIDSVEALLPLALQLTGAEPEVIDQDDTYFAVTQGRLKLREFADGSAELIHDHRSDTPTAKAGDRVRVPVPDPVLLREALARGCGLRGRVRKRRWLLRAGATRIHLDRVEGLGDFMELEVVLTAEESDSTGVRIAEGLMQALGLEHAEPLAGAYLDLLALQTSLVAQPL